MDNNFDHLSKETVVVESVLPLSESQLKDIVLNLKFDPEKVTIANKKNPALIAGLRVSHQGKILDLSLQNQLNLIKESSDE